MYYFNHAPLDEISTDRLRSNLRATLEDVRREASRYLILRRGQPIAGLVPYTEAQALVEVTRNNSTFREAKLRHQLATENRLRDAIREMGDRR